MTIASHQAARPRELGAHYTPEPIVRFMLRACLSERLMHRVGDVPDPLRILDPACGDGAFVMGALAELQRTHTDVTPSHIVSRHLFGVDIDSVAVSRLQRRLSASGAHEGQSVQSVTAHVNSNVLLGDALSGPDFKARTTRESEASASSINWRVTFPTVAETGGFDLVIGNPPYVREKSAKRLFDRLATTELGRHYRQPRMDLWHYFLHRGLDLLRPGGELCFIVNSYWTSAVSARPLIERLADETTVRQLVLLGNAPLFPGVTGRHMILHVQKHKSDAACRVIDLTRCDDGLAALTRLDESSRQTNHPPTGMIETHRTQASLFVHGRLLLSASPLATVSEDVSRLGDSFAVRQGIAENPPFVTRKMVAALPGQLDVGSGVFALSAAEVESLGLSDHERALLRPYFTARSIDRFAMPTEPTHWLLYLTRQTAPDLASLPNIARHLDRFRGVLECRREVQRGTIRWWHLHWPREERLFREPRILAVQMVRRPQFVYAETPTYLGFSVNVMQSTERSTLSLPALTAVLNSRAAEDWFNVHAKRRGVALDISGTVLRDFPLPRFSALSSNRLTDLCLRRQSADESEHAVIESEIDALLDQEE